MHSIDEDFEIGSYSLLNIESLWMELQAKYKLKCLYLYSHDHCWFMKIDEENGEDVSEDDHKRIHAAHRMIMDEFGQTPSTEKAKWKVKCSHVAKDIDTIEMINL